MAIRGGIVKETVWEPEVNILAGIYRGIVKGAVQEEEVNIVTCMEGSLKGLYRRKRGTYRQVWGAR